MSFWCFVFAAVFFGVAAQGETNGFAEFSVSNSQSYIREQSQAFTNQAGAGVEAFYTLARLQNRLGHQDEAENLARKALEYDISRADIQSFLGRIYTVEGRFEDAANSFRKSLIFDQKNAGTYRLLGLVLDQAGDHEGALKAISTSVELNPSDPAAQLVFGRLLLDRGDAKGALSHLQKSCQLDPASVNSFYVLSQAQRQIGDTAAADKTTQVFQRLREQDSKDMAAQDKAYNDQKELRSSVAGFHTDAAELFLAQGKDDLAEAQLKQAIRVAPDSDKACEMLARIYVKSGALASAREVYESLARANPGEAMVHLRLGAMLVKLKDYPAAITELKKVLEIDPNQSQAITDLALVYMGTRRELPEALELTRRCLKLQPIAENYDLVAQASSLNGLMEEARTASADAMRLDPTNMLYIEHNRRLNMKR